MKVLKTNLMLIMLSAMSLIGCNTHSTKTYVLTTTSYSYDTNYIPYIVELNGEELGGGFGSGTKRSAVLTGFQYVKWGETNSARKHKAINVPILNSKDLKDKKYLAVHLYPDDSVEITLSNELPRATNKGLEWRAKIIDDLKEKEEK